MNYTRQNANMTLTTARYILQNLQLGWTNEQIARASAVDIYYEKKGNKRKVGKYHMKSCYAMKTGHETDCNCGDWKQ